MQGALRHLTRSRSVALEQAARSHVLREGCEVCAAVRHHSSAQRAPATKPHVQMARSPHTIWCARNSCVARAASCVRLPVCALRGDVCRGNVLIMRCAVSISTVTVCSRGRAWRETYAVGERRARAVSTRWVSRTWRRRVVGSHGSCSDCGEGPCHLLWCQEAQCSFRSCCARVASINIQ